ncbi:MAG: helix-turn-helix transcriptional regulator [Roseibium sp.]|nr:helix-turn-helix transcriptional regulator [Roseibium sp.]
MSKKTPNPIDAYVGSRVRLRRIMIGMSQQKLADHLGITFQQVQKYERGANRIGASRLQHIATILKVRVAFLFDGAPGSPDEAAAETVKMDTMALLAAPNAFDLLTAYTACTPETQRSLLKVTVAASQAAAPAA